MILFTYEDEFLYKVIAHILNVFLFLETLQYYQEKTSQLQHEVVTANTQLREENERASSLIIEKEKLESKLKEANERRVILFICFFVL